MAAISSEVRAYAALDESTKQDIVTLNIGTAELFLETVDRERMPTEVQLKPLVSAARERARQGMPLASMLRAYRVGGHEMLRRLRQRRPDHDQYVLADSMLYFINCTSVAAENAYVAERNDLRHARSEITRQMLARLVEDENTSPSARLDAMRALGLDPEEPYVAAIVVATGPVGGRSASHRRLEAVLDEVERVMPTLVGAVLRRSALAIFPAAHVATLRPVLQNVVRQHGSAQTLSVGIGRPAAGSDALLATVREAERACTIGEILFPGQAINDYATLGFYDVFRRDGAIDEYVDSVLASLAHHDQAGRGELVRTLHAYFTLGMNRRATAMRLGIHPNTLDHRLRKASRVAGMEVTDPEMSFRFQLAVRLAPVCSKWSWLRSSK